MARRTRGSDDSTDTPWVRPGFVGAAALIVLALACGIYIFVGRGHRSVASAPARVSTTTVAAPATRASTSTKAGCDVLPGPQSVPQVPPANVTWQLWRGVALPSSRTAGPMKITGDIAQCFAHSPTGALLAAVQLSERVGNAPGWQQAVQAMTVPNSGRQALIAQVEQSVAGQGSAALAAPTPPSLIEQVAGFTVESYDGQTAVVALVERKEDGTMGVAPFTVQWYDGDWRLVVQADGALSGPAQTVASTVGYVAWSGV